MSRRTKIIILITVIVIVILVIIYIIAFFRARTGQQPLPLINQPAGTETAVPGLTSGQPLGLNVPLATVIKPAENSPEQQSADLNRLSLPFAERFGSYSNQSNYQNLEDLMLYMSKNFQDLTKKQIKENRAKKADTSIYFGITTKSLSAQMVDFSDQSGTATVKVMTQRKESSGSYSNAKTYYQNILINFIKEDGVWRVDSAVWQ